MLAVIIHVFHTEHTPRERFFSDDVDHLRIRFNLRSLLFRNLGKHADVVTPFTCFRRVRARPQSAVYLQNLRLEPHPLLFKPRERFVGIMREFVHEFRIRTVVAAL